MPPEVADWVEYGVLGLVVVGLLTGYLVPRPTYQREVSKSDAKDGVIETLADALRRLADKREDEQESRRR